MSESKDDLNLSEEDYKALDYIIKNVDRIYLSDPKDENYKSHLEITKIETIKKFKSKINHHLEKLQNQITELQVLTSKLGESAEQKNDLENLINQRNKLNAYNVALDTFIDIGQKHIIGQLEKYIDLKSKLHQKRLNRLELKYEKKMSKEAAKKKAETELGVYSGDFNYFSNSKGVCNGLSFNWLLSKIKYMGADPIKTLQKIALWDSTTSLPKDPILIEDMENIINSVKWFQSEAKKSWITQSQFTKAYEVIKPDDKSLTENISISFFFTENELISVLEKLAKPNTPFMITSPDHAIAMFVREENGKKVFSCYDPNYPGGEVLYTDASDAVAYMKALFFEWHGRSSDFMPIGIKTFSFADKKNQYDEVVEKEILDELLKDNTALNRKPWDEASLFAFLITEKDTNTIQRLIDEKKIDVNEPISLQKGGPKPLRPLYYAIMREPSLIPFFIKNGALIRQSASWMGDDLKLFEKLYKTNLKVAIEKRDLFSVEMLCKLKADANIPFMLAFQRGDKEICNIIANNTTFDYSVALRHPFFSRKTLSEKTMQESLKFFLQNATQQGPLQEKLFAAALDRLLDDSFESNDTETFECLIKFFKENKLRGDHLKGFFLSGEDSGAIFSQAAKRNKPEILKILYKNNWGVTFDKDTLEQIIANAKSKQFDAVLKVIEQGQKMQHTSSPTLILSQPATAKPDEIKEVVQKPPSKNTP